jgi:multiple sugar transport system substrate-binding protein
LEDVQYQQINPATYEETLLDAMAAGRSPDLVFIDQDRIVSFADKLLVIPYGSVSQSVYVNSYLDEGQLFLIGEGSLALPFKIDPLVMYWNRDMFAGAGLTAPPKSWSEFHDLAPKLYSASGSQISRTAVALGQWQNVANAKAILSTLFMQTGEYVTKVSAQGLTTTLGGSGSGGESALRYYTEFANPAKVSYSWNRSMPPSTEAFVGGRLAVYFGFASEYRELRERNPNLRFGVALMPQLQSSGTQLTYGRLTGLAIPRASQNPSGALAVAQVLTSAEAGALLLAKNTAVPARRDIPTGSDTSAVLQVFAQSAIIAQGWLDPDADATDSIFKDMVESVVSGNREPGAAISDAAQEFNLLLGR